MAGTRQCADYWVRILDEWLIQQNVTGEPQENGDKKNETMRKMWMAD